MESMWIYGLLVLFLYNNKALADVERVSNGTASTYIQELDSQNPYSHCPLYPSAHGIYTIQVGALDPFQVSCDAKIAGPGWTVIARRTHKELLFFRNWEECKRGFGHITDDFFIGLDKLHAITKGQPQELYVHMEGFGVSRYAQYDEFLIESENEYYRMSKLGSFTGDGGDSMTYNKNQKFTTYDKDNDNKGNGNCAVDYMGPWWHDACSYVNPFGMYTNSNGVSSNSYVGAFWQGFSGMTNSLEVIQMMVRPKCTCSTLK